MDIEKYKCQLRELKVYCPYNVFDLSYNTLKTLDRVIFNKPKYLEYNTDTSVLPLNEGDDIVRAYSNKEE